VKEILQESRAVAGKHRDASVNIYPYVSNTINKGPVADGVQTVGRKTSWAKDVWANYFLGDRRLGDNRHFKKDVSAKDG